MAEVKVFVSDVAESRDFHAVEIYREKYMVSQKISMIAPAAPATNIHPRTIRGARGGNLGKKQYVRDFSFDNLKTLYRMKNDLIIENVHLLSFQSVDNLIKFHRQYGVNLYLFSKMHNTIGGIFPVLNHLADNGFEPELLEDFAVAKESIVTRAKDTKSRKK